MTLPELLAPAGDLEKLKIALHYGADAVYIGGKEFSLRSFAGNFSSEEMKEGIEFAHQKGKKVYVALNILPHNEHLPKINKYLKEMSPLGPDGFIISDPSVLEICRQVVPEIPLHLSTQASVTNWQTIKFWEKQGFSRAVLAREVSLREIKDIRSRVSLGIECFVHGAMCISYSGRCLLSKYMVHRDANLGECAHPCRWRYHLVEEKRPGEFHPVFEDEYGTYIMNSRDLCMIEHIPALINAGVDCFKIEGRMKSVHYVATVTKVYRKALEAYKLNPNDYKPGEKLLAELEKVSHRPYTTGFYLDNPKVQDQIYEESSYLQGYDFIGMVKEYDPGKGMALVEQRNHFAVGETVEVLSPHGDPFLKKIEGIYSLEGEPMNRAPHPQQLLYLPCAEKLKPYDILRRARY
ncbi:peptidase U32 family protein [Candidatus Contubernalis alkaliaceticus]|uniref:peptidase U32 family protein n=1 Tax=Candidatus Contubernalis alkaliaceticus TaxID=338645 RepID=UPI001F4C29D9|nr:U32 family peptidase [Candidatus Contubernalis alkalaceticus]UNC92586.1 U32 family peptidase [Candidatus Contubernalis alkalaceticus]